MKGRPRSVEREVAAWLTEFSMSKGYSPIERIPVLGRTGPDLTINELGLVVDVKSRKSVPKSIFPRPRTITVCGDLIAVRLDELDSLFSGQEIKQVCIPALHSVYQWHRHMDEWTQEHYPQGVTTVILHRPGKKIAGCAVVIHRDKRSELYDR